MSSPPKTHKMNRSPPTPTPTPRIYNNTALSAGVCCVACSGCIAGSIGCLVGTAACTNCIKGTFCPKKTPLPKKKVEIPIRPPSYNPRKFNPITNKTIYDFDDVIIYVLPKLNFTIGDNRIGEYIIKNFNLPTRVEYADFNKLKSFLDPQIEKINSEWELKKIGKKTIGGRTKRTKRTRTNGKKRRTNKR